jgi:hypothetical protein
VYILCLRLDCSLSLSLFFCPPRPPVSPVQSSQISLGHQQQQTGEQHHSWQNMAMAFRAKGGQREREAGVKKTQNNNRLNTRAVELVFVYLCLLLQ